MLLAFQLMQGKLLFDSVTLTRSVSGWVPVLGLGCVHIPSRDVGRDEYVVNMPVGHTGKLLITQLSLKKPFRRNPPNSPRANTFSLRKQSFEVSFFLLNGI